MLEPSGGLVSTGDETGDSDERGAEGIGSELFDAVSLGELPIEISARNWSSMRSTLVR
jgi:hypothetical protein